MKKRLRKKKCVGEFQEMGFQLDATYPEHSEAELDALMDQFLLKIEELGMYCGGGFCKDRLDLFVCTGRIGTGEAERREALVAYLNGIDGIKAEAGELVDANY